MSEPVLNKLMIRKYGLIERLRLLRRGYFRLAWDGFTFYWQESGFRWLDPAAKHRPKITGQVLIRL